MRADRLSGLILVSRILRIESLLLPAPAVETTNTIVQPRAQGGVS